MSDIRAEGDFTSSVGLVITGTELQPSDVTAVLGLEPDDSWRRGDPKRVGNSFHDSGGWKKYLAPRNDGDPLAQGLQTFAELLSCKVAELQKLRDLGCHCYLDCFIGVSGAALVELQPALQRDLAALGIEIRIAIWA